MIKDPKKIKEIISKFSKVKVLVIGDLMLDEFLWGNVDRISPEAPVPVVWVERQSYMPGGASNVANNITAMGGRVFLCGIIGKDEAGGRLTNELSKNKINIDSVVIDETRPTTIKTRVVANHQQVVRIDKEDPKLPDAKLLSKLIDNAKKLIPAIDAIIIEDYGKGVVSAQLLSAIIPLAKKHKKIISVDPKVDHISLYKGVTILTPNRSEAQAASAVKIESDKDIDRAGKRLLKKLDSEAVLVTLGENGMRLFEKGGEVFHIPTVAQEVYDVSGAGDTVIGILTAALVCGASFYEASVISNFAAGIVVGKVGIATVTPAELISRMGL